MTQYANENTPPIFRTIAKLHHHGITWIVLFVILFLANQGTELLHRLVTTVSDVLLLMLFSSFDWFVLVERLLDTKRYVLFSVLSFLTVAAFAVASMFMEIEISRFFNEEQELEYYAIFLMRIIWYAIVAVVVLVFYLQQKETENIRVQENLRTEKLSTELLYLKTQINPHFLFNAINNIYSMVYMKNEHAPENILKLSEMLRYVLVDCQAEVIPLCKELKNIENFVDFQVITIGSHDNVHYEADMENPNYMLAPMLMQPLVENCFKYSRLGTNPDAFVDIRIIQKGEDLFMEARNTVSFVSVVNDKKTGIGIENVKRRLDLYYNDSYDYEYQEKDNVYTVILHLKKQLQEQKPTEQNQ